MTSRPSTRPRCALTASVTVAARASWAASPVRFSNGSTTSEPMGAGLAATPAERHHWTAAAAVVAINAMSSSPALRVSRRRLGAARARAPATTHARGPLSGWQPAPPALPERELRQAPRPPRSRQSVSRAPRRTRRTDSRAAAAFPRNAGCRPNRPALRAASAPHCSTRPRNRQTSVPSRAALRSSSRVTTSPGRLRSRLRIWNDWSGRRISGRGAEVRPTVRRARTRRSEQRARQASEWGPVLTCYAPRSGV